MLFKKLKPAFIGQVFLWEKFAFLRGEISIPSKKGKNEVA